MKRASYAIDGSSRHHKERHGHKKIVLGVIGIALVAVIGLGSYKLFWSKTPSEKIANGLQFAANITPSEKSDISAAIADQHLDSSGSSVKAITSTTLSPDYPVLSAYVPVMNAYTTKLQITSEELKQMPVSVPRGTPNIIQSVIVKATGAQSIKTLEAPVEQLPDDTLAFIPVSQLSDKVRLMSFDGSYYLDDFTKGAVFRQAVFSGGGNDGLNNLKLTSLPHKDTTLKVNMTGVTALTRLMMRKLATTNDPTYFSAKIGDFLKDADITHVSNEVSFKPGCTYSNDVFCSDPRFIETLKASGVNLVELTGNHNNDTGNQYNTDTINEYHKLGWHTFGGGLNAQEAAKPYIADQKGNKVAFLGYNYADSPSGGPIAKATTAGANSFDFDKIKSDIEAAKQQGAYVIVDVQFWECYSYPDGYVEFPICDQPIADQQATFRKIIDLGADMVIGTQAHQPQTYELYKGKQIYYGLGNLYFEQIQWPGTERGIILTHYFVDGKLLQTRLTPTIYDKDYQTHISTVDQSTYLLNRLKDARSAAGLNNPFN